MGAFPFFCSDIAFARYAKGNACGGFCFSKRRVFYKLTLCDSIASNKTKLSSPV